MLIHEKHVYPWHAAGVKAAGSALDVAVVVLVTSLVEVILYADICPEMLVTNFFKVVLFQVLIERPWHSHTPEQKVDGYVVVIMFLDSQAIELDALQPEMADLTVLKIKVEENSLTCSGRSHLFCETYFIKAKVLYFYLIHSVFCAFVIIRC